MADPQDNPEAPPPETDSAAPLLDASKPLDFDRVESGWKETLRQRETFEADAQRAFREEPSSPTPSSVIQSAEGAMLFPGLHVGSNGPLSKVARAALQDDFPPDAEPSSHDDP